MLTTPALTAPDSNPTASGLLRRATPLWGTTLALAIDASTATIPLSSTSDLSTDSAVTIVIDPGNAKQECIIGFPEGSNLVNAVRHVEGATIGHDANAVVMMINTAIDWNSMIDYLRVEHDEAGHHKDITADSITVGGKALQDAAVPVGTMSMFAGAAAPAGYLLADGSSLLRSSYAALFAVIGTTFGAADGTHFNLPDMRGRVAVAPDGAAGRLSANETLAAAGGAENHFHWQTMGMDATLGYAEVDGAGSGHSSVINVDRTVFSASGRATAGLRRDGTYDSNGMPPYLVVNYIIKT